jgi:hypothetical protein
LRLPEDERGAVVSMSKAAMDRKLAFEFCLTKKSSTFADPSIESDVVSPRG